MATIAMDGDFLVYNDGTDNRLTVHKREVTLAVIGNELVIKHSGKYETHLVYSDVSSPAAASAELLRVAVKNLLIA